MRYASLKYIDPAEAKMISDEMNRIEGSDFTELALDGLVKGKPYYKRKANKGVIEWARERK
jgi:hypothetical protein